MKTKRKIIICDFKSGEEWKGIIKICCGAQNHREGYYLISDCPWFDGQECSSKDKEGFNYSWILINEDDEQFKKINLNNMKYFREEDWTYDFPYDDENDLDWNEFLNIGFDDDRKNNFEDIEL